MAANTTSGPAVEPSSGLPYEQLYYIEQAVIPFAVRNLCIQIAFSASILTLYFFLVLLSQPHHRRTWTFALVTLVAGLFFVTAFTNSSQLMHTLERPTIKVPLSIAFCDAFITLCLPWFADWVIFLRAVALVPVRERKKPKWLALAGIVLLVKIIRGAFLIVLNIHLHKEMRDSMSPADLGNRVWPLAPSTWVEYGGMLIDTTVCSGICIWRLTSLMTPSRSESRSRVLQERLRLLLFNTISSFIFPAISALVMIILAAVGTYETYSSAPKINSGIVAMNVLVAMLIPIIDASVSEHRQSAQRDAAISDSFLRRPKSRTLSSSQQGHVAPRLRKGVVQTTMVERSERGLPSVPEKDMHDFERSNRGEGPSTLGRLSDAGGARPGTGGSITWPASSLYEPSVAEKTPILEAPGASMDDVSQRWGANASSSSFGDRKSGGEASVGAPVAAGDIPPIPLLPAHYIRTDDAQAPAPQSPQRPTSRSGAGTPSSPAASPNDGHRAGYGGEMGPLATTDEHRIRLRSMPRRQRA